MIFTVITTLHAALKPPFFTVPFTRTPPDGSTTPSFVTFVTRTLAVDAASGSGVGAAPAAASGVAAGAADCVEGPALIVPIVPFPFPPPSFRSRATS
jgi:hypothetical protein